MGQKLGKLDKMALTERERGELEKLSRSESGTQRRREANMRRIKAMLDEPPDPELQKAGIADARKALGVGQTPHRQT